jgi:translation initiation factor IF-3
MLNTDFIYLNNFTKIRVNLEYFAREMQENEGGNKIYTEIHTSLCKDV